jgi:hypothetical protein
VKLYIGFLESQVEAFPLTASPGTAITKPKALIRRRYRKEVVVTRSVVIWTLRISTSAVMS